MIFIRLVRMLMMWACKVQKLVTPLGRTLEPCFAGALARTRAKSSRRACRPVRGPHREAMCALLLPRPSCQGPSVHRRCVDDPPRGLSRAIRRTSARISRWFGERPARRPYVQRFAIKRRCHRGSVARVMMKERQRARDRSQLAAARKSRSVHVIAGRRLRRWRTASSCRSTMISSSLNSFDRKRKAASCRARRSTT